jgi:predicted enzyme related to lactoylglutathione lyase
LSEPPWKNCPVLGVRDVQAAADFFEKRLGFTVGSVFGPDPAEGAVYAIVERGGAQIHLQIRRRPLDAPRESIESDLYMHVPDVDRLHEELLGRGAQILRPPLEEPYGMRDFVAAGPEGLRLVFGSPLEEP